LLKKSSKNVNNHIDAMNNYAKMSRYSDMYEREIELTGIRSRRPLFFKLAVTVLAALFANAVYGDQEQARSCARHSDVQLLQQIDLKDFGTSTGLRLGDLTGNGELDIILAQNRHQNISCITAMDALGNILWQVGTPERDNYRATSDLPIQIYDLNGDGANEVVYIMDGRIRVLKGATGELIREGDLPAGNANDCIAFADLKGNGRAGEILVKDRYHQIWALDQDFEVLWTFKPGTRSIAHHPWPHDLTGDGHDEVLIGPHVLDHLGNQLWHAEGLERGEHSDGTAIGDVTGDGYEEVAIAACSPRLVLVDHRGELLWEKTVRHAQHVIIGNFRTDLPGQEVVVLDRGTDRSAAGQDAIIVYDSEGETLWHEQRSDVGLNRWITIITKVSNWDDQDGDLILGYRRGGTTPPTLYDGFGTPVAAFPFPDLERQQFAQHADIFGDGRVEIVVWNEKEIRIYTNAARAPRQKEGKRQSEKRLYNFTHYTGMP
jgi:hypothetical protein